MTGVSAYADFSVENAEGVAIRYRYINDNNEVVVANDNNFRNLYSGNLVIPEEITWYDITNGAIMSVWFISSPCFMYRGVFLSPKLPRQSMRKASREMDAAFALEIQ